MRLTARARPLADSPIRASRGSELRNSRRRSKRLRASDGSPTARGARVAGNGSSGSADERSKPPSPSSSNAPATTSSTESSKNDGAVLASVSLSQWLEIAQTVAVVAATLIAAEALRQSLRHREYANKLRRGGR